MEGKGTEVPVSLPSHVHSLPPISIPTTVVPWLWLITLHWQVIINWSPQWPLRFTLQFSSVQSLSCVRLFETPWIAACQASLSITNSRSSLRLTSIESVMPSSHLILCHPLLLLPLIPPSIRVFSNESTLRMRWPKYLFYGIRHLYYKDNAVRIGNVQTNGVEKPEWTFWPT